MATSIPCAGSPNESQDTDLMFHLQSITLEDVQKTEERYKPAPFPSLCISMYAAKGFKGQPDEIAKPSLYSMHKTMLDQVDTSLSPAQLLFGCLYLFIVAPIDADLLFENIALLASKILTEDWSSEHFFPEQPSTDWLEAIREKLRQAKNIQESTDAFISIIPVLQEDRPAASYSPLQYWHNFCYLLKVAFPDIHKHKARAFAVLLNNQIPHAFARISFGLKYLFQTPHLFPISYDAWARIPQPHAFTVAGIVEFIRSNRKASSDAVLYQALFAIEALFGDKATSPTFAEKIQGAYLRSFIRFAECPKMPASLIAPLIERLCGANDLDIAERIASIEEAILHVTTNPCTVAAGIQICSHLYAFLKRIQEAERYDWHEYQLKPVLEEMANIKWNLQGAFTSDMRQVEAYTLAARPFAEIRELLAHFKAAKTEFPDDTWPIDGGRGITILYIKILREALKKLKELPTPGIHIDRWHKIIQKKNELVVELCNLLYSVHPPFTERAVRATMTPLIQCTISRFTNELIFYKQGDLVLVGRRDNIEVLTEPQANDHETKPSTPPRYYISPHGCIIKSKKVKIFSPSPLGKKK